MVGLTNMAGALVNTYTYDRYGNILAQTEGVAQPFKFAGVYYDSEYNLHKMGARYYDAAPRYTTNCTPETMNQTPNPSSSTLQTTSIQLCTRCPHNDRVR